ncbi:hypothetical protein ACMFMF_008198 [Clarireedia jacksonii]
MGKGKSSNEEAQEHVSRPISSLKDPASFGPPPKKYHGGAALPNQTTPDTSGLGAHQEAEEAETERREGEAKRPPPPPVPYRADRTGLSTAHLPPPPGRKDGADGKTPPAIAPADAKPKPPGLPPRLPPRQNSNPSPSAPSPPPTYGAATAEADPSRGILNQGALNRLGAAGVSVPGFGIGGKNKPALPPPAQNSTASPSPPPPAPRTNSAQVNELQSRFSRLTSSSPKPDAPTEGTSFAQKQAAFKTAAAFRNDPSSVSLSDAKSAASTANNFRERHGEQVKSGWASANKLNTKYGIADKVGALGGVGPAREASPARSVETAESPVGNGTTALAKKKPAPPPPPKKRGTEIGVPSADAGTPPPIPLATKPKPSLKITWDASSPAHTVRAQQIHLPAPPPLSPSDLSRLATLYSPRVAAWAEAQMGTQVGNGECWTLAHEALKHVARECAARGEEPCMSSQSYVHGYLIYEFKDGVAEPRGGVREAGVVRGDVVQFLSSHFKDARGGQKWAGAPDHTSVVVGVEPNGVVKVVEQNVGGVKKVMKGEYNMAELVKGEVRIFRAVGENWAGKMDPSWD